MNIASAAELKYHNLFSACPVIDDWMPYPWFYYNGLCYRPYNWEKGQKNAMSYCPYEGTNWTNTDVRGPCEQAFLLTVMEAVYVCVMPLKHNYKNKGYFYWHLLFTLFKCIVSNTSNKERKF